MLSRGNGSILRALLLGLLVTALMNPSIRREDRMPLPGVLAVVLDRSQSQTLDQRKAQTDAARAALAERLGRLPETEIRWIDVAQTTAPTAPSFSRRWSAVSPTCPRTGSAASF